MVGTTHCYHLDARYVAVMRPRKRRSTESACCSLRGDRTKVSTAVATRPFRSLTLIVSVKAVTPTAARRLAGREYIRDFLTVGERASDSVTLRC